MGLVRDTTYATALRRLQRWLPLPLPFRVKLVRGLRKRTGDWAYCSRQKGGFLLEMDMSMDDAWRRDTIIHEWAHALSWGQEKEDHGPAWGVAHSRCYRVAIEGWRPRVKAA